MPLPAFVQGNSGDSGAGHTSEPVAYSSGVTAGNLLIAFTRCTVAGTVGISDSQGNTWKELFLAVTNSTQPVAAWYAFAKSTGANTVTVTNSSSSTIRLTIGEWSGVSSAYSVDVVSSQASDQSDTAQAITTPLMQTQGSNELLLAFGTQTLIVATGVSTNNSFTIRVENTSSDSAIADSVASAGSQSTTFTWTGVGNTDLTAILVAFKNLGTPTFSPVAGDYTSSQTVTITSPTVGSTIHYTTDGTTPTESSPSIANGGTITVSKSSIIRAISSFGGVDSSIGDATYQLGPINIWTPKGTVIGTANSSLTGQPNVLYEGSAKILSGTVFKMWYTNGSTGGAGAGVYYAESTDGLSWTQFGSNPVIAGQGFSHIWKQGSTYYMYSSTAPFIAASNINVYTSSDGVTWTLANANAITASLAWETPGVFQLQVIEVDSNGTWWGYYTGGTFFTMGLATSIDGINWTKSLNNPIPNAGEANNAYGVVAGKITGWTALAMGVNLTPSNLSSSVGLLFANAPGGPWTETTYPGFYATLQNELIAHTGGTAFDSQLGDPAIVQANGNTYIYYSVGFVGSDLFVINCAVATGMTLAQVVQTSQGVVNVPIPFNLGLNCVSLASDNATRANANPLGSTSPWTSNILTTPAQLLSNEIEASGASAESSSFYNGIQWNADQWSQITASACTSAYVGVQLRVSQSNPGTETAGYSVYRLYWNGTLGTSGTWTIDKYVNSVYTSLATGSLTLHVGDTLTGSIIGSTLSFYWNGFLVDVITDSSNTVGAPGFMMVSGSGGAGTSAISAWSGGTFQNTPSLSPASGGSDLWFLQENLQFDVVKRHRGF